MQLTKDILIDWTINCPIDWLIDLLIDYLCNEMPGGSRGWFPDIFNSETVGRSSTLTRAALAPAALVTSL